MNLDELRSKVETIAFIMMENRSFDHVLGHLSLPSYGGRANVEGVRDLTNPAFQNSSQNGTLIGPFEMGDKAFPNDLPHERPFVTTQLAYAPALGRFTMNGFVTAYETFTGTSGVLSPPPMGILTPDALPTTSFFAREFMVADHWFAPLPASTQPNRLMAFAGDTLLDMTRNGLMPDQTLVFDWLTSHGVRWRVYTAGLSFFTLMPKMWPWLLSDKFRPLASLSFDAQHEADSTFPQVIFVEPDYNDSPIHLSGHGSDNHPPLPMGFGEQFLKQAYEALTSNVVRWSKMVILLTYDEHGGFFDHVPPQKVRYVPPTGATFAAFENTGIRVPTVVISPFVDRYSVSSDICDHTSFLQMIAERFGEPGETYSATVAARASSGINSLTKLLDSNLTTRPPPDPPDMMTLPPTQLVTTKTPVTSLEASFANAIDAFRQAHGAEALAKFPEIAHLEATR